MSLKTIIFCILINTSLAAFENAEHMAIGDAVKLQFLEGKTHEYFTLSNGLEVTYGEIVALAGDYFAVNEAPISQGKTIEDQKARFLNAFNTLAESKSSPSIAFKLVETFKNTLKAIIEGDKAGKTASEVYAEIGGSLMKECNVITGGGCFLSPLFPLGNAVQQLLSDANWDHFVPHALTAYQAGHLVAMEEAIRAGCMKDVKGLEKAYAMNAFACHYLSDSFSAGHMRTPRKELSQHVELGFVAALLMDYMHGEDSKEGLQVKNLKGDIWTAYGDSYYFEPENAFSRDVLKQIMQISADEVYFAFQNGKEPDSKNIENLLPLFDLLHDVNSHENTAPLFFWDSLEVALKHRADINDLNGYEWKSVWWGWTTLIDLGEYYRPLTSRQMALHEALRIMDKGQGR